MFHESLANQLRLVDLVLQRNLDGLTHEESLRQPEPGGNSINWVLGHLVSTQSGMQRTLGENPVWDEERGRPYARGSNGTLSETDAVPLEVLRKDWKQALASSIDGLSRLDSEKLGTPAPFSPTQNPDETVGSLLEAIVFHQAYHCGQTGVLRRLAGREGAIR